MGTSNNIDKMIPFRATHPGFVIAEEIDYMGVKRKDFAAMIGVQTSYLSELLKGKRSLSEQIAMQIEQHTELKAETLMKLQEQYEINIERIAQRDATAAKKKTSANSTIRISIPTDTYDRISSAAQQQGTTIQTFIRNMLTRAVIL